MLTKEKFMMTIGRYMDAQMPIIYIDTLEIGLCRKVIQQIASAKHRECISWSLHSEGRSPVGRVPGDLLSVLKAVEDDFQRKVIIIEDISSQIERPEIVSYLRYLAERLVDEDDDLTDCTVVI